MTAPITVPLVYAKISDPSGTPLTYCEITPEIARQIVAISGEREYQQAGMNTAMERIVALEKWLGAHSKSQHIATIVPLAHFNPAPGTTLMPITKPDAQSDDAAIVAALTNIVAKTKDGFTFPVCHNAYAGPDPAARAIIAAIQRGEIPHVSWHRIDPETTRRAWVEERDKEIERLRTELKEEKCNHAATANALGDARKDAEREKPRAELEQVTREEAQKD